MLFVAGRRQLSTDTTHLKEQFQAEVAALEAMYSKKLSEAESGRQALVATFMEEANVGRERMLEEQAHAVEVAVARVIAEHAAHLESTVDRLTKHWEVKMSELAAQKDAEKERAISELHKQVSCDVLCA